MRRTSKKLPQYSMVYVYRIFRVEDGAEITNVFRGFRGDSVAACMKQFKKLAARERTPKNERKT